MLHVCSLKPRHMAENEFAGTAPRHAEVPAVAVGSMSYIRKSSIQRIRKISPISCRYLVCAFAVSLSTVPPSGSSGPHFFGSTYSGSVRG